MISSNLLSSELRERVKKIAKEETVIVAVSGGPDSICLLELILEMNPKKVVVAHVNYNLRAKSHLERDYLLKTYNKNNISVEAIDVKDSPDKNTQQWARTIRFDFFRSLANKYNASYVFIGSTNNDLIESYFLREIGRKDTPLFRVSSRYKELQIERPLLFTSKKEIIKILYQSNIHYFIDETNKKNLYLRNKVRNKIKDVVPKELITKEIKLEHILEDWLSRRVKEHHEEWRKQNYKVDYILHLDPVLSQEIIRQYLIELFPTRSLGNKVNGLYSFIVGRKYHKKFKIEKDKYLMVEKRLLVTKNT